MTIIGLIISALIIIGACVIIIWDELRPIQGGDDDVGD